MPKYQAPRSDTQRLTFLNRAVITASQDIAAGNTYVSQHTIDAITAFLPQFEAGMNAISAKLSARTKDIRERTAAMAKVETFTRDLWEVLKRRVARHDEPADVLLFYQLPLDGTVPYPTTQAEWLLLADQVVAGDAAAVALGHPAAVCPSAAELATVLERAQAESGDVAMADRAYDAAQKTVQALRPQADRLIAEVMAELRFNLRGEDASSRRRIMRTYGANFRHSAGKQAEPDAAPIPVEGE